MKVLGINGSARRDGNTAILIRTAFAELESAGVETELVQIAGRAVPGCKACYECVRKKDGKCSQKKDIANELIAKMVEADGVILGSPTYFTDVSAEMKALIDRAGLVVRANGHQLARKVGAAAVAVRRAGSIHAYDTLNHFFLINHMIVPGSSYWNLGIGREPGEVEQDEEGMNTMRDLGRNMAWLLERLHA